VITPTAAQRSAIAAPMGPVLVVAGPGAGKTFCLIERIRFLVTEGAVLPERVCAVTFTNKAAEEISARLHGALGEAAERVTRGTLHALCADVLRAHGGAVDIPRGFGVADDAYQRLLLRRLGVRGRQRMREALDAFTRARLRGSAVHAREADLLERYRTQLRRRDLLDFDDLIVETVRLLELPDDAAAAAVARRWDCVLVDEFQDLDPAQYRIIAALGSGHRNVFAVGDDEQSIFSWRGADPTVLARFQRDFGVERPIVLDRNRRCARPIFERARQLIQVEPSLFTKDLVADRESPFPVAAVALPDDRAEAVFLIRDLLADHAAAGLPWGDYAVLYRTHEIGHALEGALLEGGIPCRLARGRALQDDPIAGHVIAALRLMRHPDDPVLVEAFAELVLPEDLLTRVRVHARSTRVPLLEAVRAVAGSLVRGSADARRLWRLLYQVEGLDAQFRTHHTLPALVEGLLSQRIGPYTNVLEEREDELGDPAGQPDAVALAGALAGALHGRGRVVIVSQGPVRVGLRGLLLAAGLTRVAYDGAAGTEAGADVSLDADPVTVFKSLQLVHCRDLAHQFDDFVAFDLETTGRDPRDCEIVEVGAVRVRGGAVVDRFHRLVRPAVPVSEGASAVHGYTDADLANAPPFAEVWPAFRAFVGGDLLVAHNAFEFDLPVLRRLATLHGGTDDIVVYDSLILARALVAGRASLEALAERFAVPLPRAHHALDDAEALAGVFVALTRLQLARTRKTALAHLLDFVGLSLALGPGPVSDEAELLREVSRTHALGPYSDCLGFYEAERRRLHAPDLPDLDVVIDRLGGQALLERLRTTRTAEQRYPEAYARLMRLVGESTAADLGDAVDRLLETVALSTSREAEIDPARVNLLTLHATKGLEFSRVYVVGVEDHQLPGWGAMAYGRTDEIREARRLLYVGMTRARDRLVLTRVATRRGREAGGNRFLDEMGLAPRSIDEEMQTAGPGTATDA
jgi:DNA polymerase III epsilon subunit family exonuclease